MSIGHGKSEGPMDTVASKQAGFSLSWSQTPEDRFSRDVANFMPVRDGSLQQNSREGSNPLRWDATGGIWTFPKKSMWRMRRFAVWTRMHNDLLTMVKKRQLRWYGHIKNLLAWRGTVKGGKMRGWQKDRWKENIAEWTGMGLGGSWKSAKDRERLKCIVAKSFVVRGLPSRLMDWDEVRWDQIHEIRFWNVWLSVCVYSHLMQISAFLNTDIRI